MPLLLLDGAGIANALDRMAIDVIRASDLDGLVVIGIVARGDVLARRLVEQLAKRGRDPVPHGVLDITLYRDDIHQPSGQAAVVRPTQIDFSLDDRPVLLVDDVLHTGRTIRAAMDALADLGRPKLIRLAVLVDRGGRQLPIQPDYVGIRVEAADQRVKLTLSDHPPTGEEVVLG